MERPRLTLTWKIFLASAAVVLAVLVSSLVLTSRSANRAADAAVTRGLGQAREEVAAFLEGRERELAGAALVFTQNPDFRVLVESRRTSDVFDQSVVAAQQIGATWVQITDAEGVRLAKSDEPAAEQHALGGSMLIAGALGGEVTTGAGTSADSAIFQAVAVPVSVPAATGPGRVIGVLMAALLVDDSTAMALRTATESEVIFYVLDTLGVARVVASTLPVNATLRDFVGERSEVHVARVDTDDSPSAPRGELVLDGTHYLGDGAALQSADGNPLGGYIALRSREAELAPFDNLRRTILYGGVVGLVLAILVSFLVARQITHPLRSLVEATRRAAEGDYAAEVKIESEDEIGALASAFRAMLGDLRDKQALVDFLGGTDPGRTVPMALSATERRAVGSATLVQPGERFAGRYEVKGILGAGGMGIVYKAIDLELGEVIAIKTLKRELISLDPSALERFRSEIRLARRISHRNVVRTHDIGEVDGMYYITMEYVEGKSLKELIRTRGRLPVSATLTIAKQLCRALEVAHEQGVIHRDIKPQNIVVEPDGVLKVMDFGIARLQARQSGMTQAGSVIGTPEYMAPEHLTGDDIDARVDIYATGVVIYECLTGELPLTAPSPIVLLARLIEETPVAPRALHADIPARLSALVMRTLAKDRNDRPRSAGELHDLLAEIG